jgi:hypothetical protein
MLAAIPPTVILIPAALALSIEITATCQSLMTVPSMMPDSIVEPIFRPLDSAMALYCFFPPLVFSTSSRDTYEEHDAAQGGGSQDGRDQLPAFLHNVHNASCMLNPRRRDLLPLARH